MPGLKEENHSSNGVSVPVNEPALQESGSSSIRRLDFDSTCFLPSPADDGAEGYDESEARNSVGEVVVIDVMGSDGVLQSLRVKPAIFLGLLKRLDQPVVAHYKRRLGKHLYFAYCGDFIIETHTRTALDVSCASASTEEAPQPGTGSRIEKTEAGIGAVRRSAAAWDGVQKEHPLIEFYTAERCYVTEWWNRSEDPALSVARMRVEAGVGTRPYRLHGISERYLFLAGRGMVEIDGVEREVGPGDGLFINAGSWRCITNTGDRDLGFLAICRPRFRRLDPNSPKREFAGRRPSGCGER